MRTFVIACPELPDRMAAAKNHLAAHGIDADIFRGIHAETFKLLCFQPYEHNHPGKGELNPMSQVGLCLSHYMLWQTLEFVPGDHFMILEDDAKFVFGWQDRMAEVMECVPTDWDIILIGNSHTRDKERLRINGDVYDVKYPFCTHAYVLAKKAIPTLLAECRSCNSPIDINLIQNAYPKLRVYTVLPRIVGQRWTNLPE